MQAQTSPPLQRGDPWFNDGNIILLTDDFHVAFKVHRGVLARHSEIFQSMFEIPQPASSPDMEFIGGCQVVRMYDSPSELGTLITALYDGIDFYHRSAEDFFILAGILRLATKYFIGPLRTKAIKHLSQTWPYTLQGHDEMVEKALTSHSVDGLTYPYVHPLHVLNLARETNVRIIVPSALYFLSLYMLADILRADHPKLTIEHPSRPSSQLGVQEITEYTLMYQYRLDNILVFTRQFCARREPFAGCSNSDDGTSCSRVFSKMAQRFSRSWVLRTGLLHFVAQAIQDIDFDTLVCEPCRAEFRRDANHFREEIWNGLPALIGMPSWDILVGADLGSEVRGTDS